VQTAQRLIEAFPKETAPRFLLRDRGQIYDEEFQCRSPGMKFDEVTESDLDRFFNLLTAVL